MYGRGMEAIKNFPPLLYVASLLAGSIVVAFLDRSWSEFFVLLHLLPILVMTVLSGAAWGFRNRRLAMRLGCALQIVALLIYLPLTLFLAVIVNWGPISDGSMVSIAFTVFHSIMMVIATFLFARLGRVTPPVS